MSRVLHIFCVPLRSLTDLFFSCATNSFKNLFWSWPFSLALMSKLSMKNVYNLCKPECRKLLKNSHVCILPAKHTRVCVCAHSPTYPSLTVARVTVWLSHLDCIMWFGGQVPNGFQVIWAYDQNLLQWIWVSWSQRRGPPWWDLGARKLVLSDMPKHLPLIIVMALAKHFLLFQFLWT